VQVANYASANKDEIIETLPTEEAQEFTEKIV